jgi:uncharacterized protein YceH (UPF0502 family)
MQLFSGDAPPEVEEDTHASMPDAGTSRPDLAGRVAALEAEVTDLRRALEVLKTLAQGPRFPADATTAASPSRSADSR